MSESILLTDSQQDTLPAAVASLDGWRDGGLAELRRAFAPFDSVGEHYASPELNARIPMSQSALSQQLAVLRRDGLVRTRRDAQTIYYSVAPSNAGEIIEVLRRLYCGRSR